MLTVETCLLRCLPRGYRAVPPTGSAPEAGGGLAAAGWRRTNHGFFARGAFLCDPVGNGPAEVGRAVSARLRLRRSSAPAADGALGQLGRCLEQPVVQDQCADHRQIECEAGGYPHHVAAALQHGGGQAGAFRSEHDAGIQRMAERGEFRPSSSSSMPPARSPAACRTHRHRRSATAAHAPAYPRYRRAGRRGHRNRADDEAERGAESMRGAQQGADIGRLRHPLDADAEMADLASAMAPRGRMDDATARARCAEGLCAVLDAVRTPGSESRAAPWMGSRS